MKTTHLHGLYLAEYLALAFQINVKCEPKWYSESEIMTLLKNSGAELSEDYSANLGAQFMPRVYTYSISLRGDILTRTSGDSSFMVVTISNKM
jgi:hypothetical protein